MLPRHGAECCCGRHDGAQPDIPRRRIVIRASIYGVVGVVMVWATVRYPDFRYLYLPCAVLAFGRAVRLAHSAHASSAESG
jgi:hypothetical protein